MTYCFPAMFSIPVLFHLILLTYAFAIDQQKIHTAFHLKLMIIPPMENMRYIKGNRLFKTNIMLHSIYHLQHWNNGTCKQLTTNFLLCWKHQGINDNMTRGIICITGVDALVSSTKQTTFRWATCCLICFITIFKPFLTHDLDYGSYRLPNLEMGLTVDVTGQQGILTPPRHLILPLIYSEVRVRPVTFSDLYFP
jgi:hypothetical protein